MHNDWPIAVFLINCRSLNEKERAEQLARADADLSRDLVNTTRAFPGGIEKRQAHHHRLRDYFDSIEIESKPNEPASFKMIFAPRKGANRYWRDLMVQILKSIGSVGGVSVSAIKR